MKKIHYSWVIMVGCFFLMTDLGLQLSLVSVFLKPVSESIAVSRTAFSATYLISGPFGILSGICDGKLYRRFSMRRVIMVGSCMTALSIIGFSFATSLWQFYVIAPFYGFGSGLTSTIPVSILLSNWFQEKRGIATSIAFTGSSIGNLIFTQLSVHILLVLDWRMTYRILAVTRLCIVLPVALFLIKAHPQQAGLQPYGAGKTGTAHPDGKQSGETVTGITQKAFMKTPVFYCLGFSAFSIALCILGIQNHFQSFLTDLGYTSVFAANVLSLLLIAQIIGKFSIGILLDKVGPRFSSLCVMVLFLFGCCCLLYTGKVSALAFVGAFAIGLSASQVTIFPPYMTSEIVGNREYPAIIGKVQLFNTLGTNINSTATSMLYDMFHGYNGVWIVYMGLAVVSCISYLFALRKGKGYRAM